MISAGWQPTERKIMLTGRNYEFDMSILIVDDNELIRIVNETHARKGFIIIPAFAVGRTQQLVFTLNKLFRDGKIPAMPVAAKPADRFADYSVPIVSARVATVLYNPTQRAALAFRGVDPAYGFHDPTP